MMTKTVAILYATKGGMGDVGKFAITLSKIEPSLSCNIVPIALSIENSSEGTDKGLEVDVVDQPDLKKATEELLGDFESSILKIDVAKDSAEQDIADAIAGSDAVISCLGNRQPSMERWCSMGTQKVIAAMKAKKVERLVSLSSFGIGDDYLKTSAISILWRGMLRTILRSCRKDLVSLEKTVRASGLDYVLVRPVGLTPEEPPQGSCDHLLSKEDGNLDILMSKKDAAAFMLSEALDPTIHNKEVTIGYSTTQKKAEKIAEQAA